MNEKLVLTLLYLYKIVLTESVFERLAKSDKLVIQHCIDNYPQLCVIHKVWLNAQGFNCESIPEDSN